MPVRRRLISEPAGQRGVLRQSAPSRAALATLVGSQPVLCRGRDELRVPCPPGLCIAGAVDAQLGNPKTRDAGAGRQRPMRAE